MIKSFIKIAIRSYFKNGTTSIINFLGLTVGLTSCFLIFINVNRELSYDRFHEKKDRIFRILSIDNAIGVSNNTVGITIPALGNGMKKEIPEVENVVNISPVGKSLVKYKETTLYSKDLIYSEPSFFEVFDFKLKEGNPATCLKDPKTAILTETMAKKIFGNENPMGKVFSADGSDDLVVTGILADEKRPSHFKFDIILSINPSPSDTTTAQFLNSWQSIAMTEYALLRNPNNVKQVIVDMDSLMRRNKVLAAWKATLQPLKEVHLYSNDIIFDEFNKNKGNIKYVQSLSLVAIIILLIASFNYMNLSTARSTKRAREVGVRKTMGALKFQLISQHLSEAFIQVLLSVFVALGIVELINHYFVFVDSTVIGYIISSPIIVLYILGLVFILGIISGTYPALILSSYKPQVVLKGKFETGKKGLWLRRFLVSMQFIAAFVMILGTVVVVKQVRYSLSKDKGFNTSQIVNIQLDNNDVRTKYEALKTELQKISGVNLVATSGSMPGLGFGRTGITPEGAQSTDIWITSIFSIDENYISLMKMEMVEGENFRKDITQQPIPVIVNESLVKAAGWDKGLNKKIKLGRNRDAIVIGVVKDFHFTSMRHKIEPIMMVYRSGVNGILSIKVAEANISNTLKSIEQTWKSINGSIPLEYKFFDESFNQLFEKEQEFSKLFFRFTILSIFVAMLGLFGLAAYSAEQRTKEIGIRKTFGGTNKQMVLLQSYEYIRLVAIAICIGVPVAVFIMRTWLQGFEYRVKLNVLPFILAALIILIVTLITVSIQSYKAAQKNPTDSLKYE
ncbi:MAG: ABC transporter permease [Bacteroidales bacterium]|nr:ABC transporter permease [Bacteroidales bacterium]